MDKPVLTIFYQFNPWDSTIGGIQTLIKAFIKYCPDEFELRLVGTESSSNLPIGKWHKAEFSGKEFTFMPLLFLPDDDVRNFIPTTVKYTYALMGRCFSSDFMHFHRLEPTLTTRNWQGEKTLFIHNDIQAQMQASSKGDKNAILWRKFPAAYFGLEKLLIDQFDRILSTHPDSVQFYRQRYPMLANRIGDLEKTFDNEIYYPLSRSQRQLGKQEFAQSVGILENKRLILFVGRLHPQKDPILLIQSFAALKDPNAHLLIVGEGEMANQIRSEINQLGLCEQVTMLGAIKQEEVADLYRISDLYVLTSAYEAIPLTVLEALACGTPVVTTICGQTPKLVTSGSGVVCSSRTPECIADGLRKVLSQPDDYLIQNCVQAAKAYSADSVIGDFYGDMFASWEQRQLLRVNSKRHFACF